MSCSDEMLRPTSSICVAESRIPRSSSPISFIRLAVFSRFWSSRPSIRSIRSCSARRSSSSRSWSARRLSRLSHTRNATTAAAARTTITAIAIICASLPEGQGLSVLAYLHLHVRLPQVLQKVVRVLRVYRHHRTRPDRPHEIHDVLGAGVARGVQPLPLLRQAGDALTFLIRQPHRPHIEVIEPLPQPPEVQLLLLGVRLARRVDVRAAVDVDVDEVLRVPKAEAQNVVSGRIV